MVVLVLPFPATGTGLTSQRMADRQATGRLPCFRWWGMKAGFPSLCLSLCEHDRWAQPGSRSRMSAL
jgi:hypothetical protein